MADTPYLGASGTLRNPSSATEEHELQDRQHRPRPSLREFMHQWRGNSGGARGSGLQTREISDAVRFDTVARYDDNDGRRTGAVPFAGFRAYTGGWPDKVYFNGATNPDTKRRLKENDTTVIRDLRDAGDGTISDEMKINILSHISQEMMLRDGSRRAAGAWQTLCHSLAGVLCVSLVVGTVSVTTVRRLSDDNNSLFRQLQECLNDNAEGTHSTAAAVGITPGQGQVEKWSSLGKEEDSSGPLRTPEARAQADEAPSLTIEHTEGAGEDKRSVAQRTEEEFYRSMKHFMQSGIDYFSQFEKPEDQMQVILNDPDMREVLSTLGMSAKQYTNFCGAVMELTPEDEVADSTVEAVEAATDDLSV